ncbi:flagellar hook-length control protein FliK [Rhodovulum imhoffii]|uniref:Flagellar hook-length control protein FliK n=1 Tax=Rhodovulum imhoffii TaxID=365340 RepID=A0A2T5BRR4_9RHOB|nr:flagellar hook-length control protein FliK [Rhodovulum imhoffii]MBK5932495.1 hypothetical protein [Rhodovulum imhoffii]PTN01979.1 flagellar hook-length control protein FliK [Rhodovulum imhoffii]
MTVQPIAAAGALLPGGEKNAAATAAEVPASGFARFFAGLFAAKGGEDCAISGIAGEKAENPALSPPGDPEPPPSDDPAVPPPGDLEIHPHGEISTVPMPAIPGETGGEIGARKTEPSVPGEEGPVPLPRQVFPEEEVRIDPRATAGAVETPVPVSAPLVPGPPAPAPRSLRVFPADLPQGEETLRPDTMPALQAPIRLAEGAGHAPVLPRPVADAPPRPAAVVPGPGAPAIPLAETVPQIGAPGPEGHAPLSAPVEIPRAGGVSTPVPAPVPVPVPANLATQVAEVIRTTPEGAVDVHLRPEELGRLRLTISPSDAGVSVTVQADRPETVELMRRHIDQLGAQLREMGYGQVSFSFGQHRQAPQGETPARSEGGGEQPDPSRPVRLRLSAGLDIRL